MEQIIIYFNTAIVVLFTAVFGIFGAFGKEKQKGIADITYHRDFPYKKSYDKKQIKDCYKFYKKMGEKVLRCRERIVLLRPLKVIASWLDRQEKSGYLNFSVKDMDIHNVHSHIKLIKLYSDQFKQASAHGKYKSMVTGLFMRHTFDVKNYTFITKKTNKISKMNVTSNHLFYVKNKNIFIPISQVSSEDLLINKTGDLISLAVAGSHIKHSSYLDNNKPIVVYNLELSTRHTYFVGEQYILVHNNYVYIDTYFKTLENNGFVYPKKGVNDDVSIYIKVPKEEKIKLAATAIEQRKIMKSSSLPQSVSTRFRHLGFTRSRIDETGKNFFIWVLECGVDDLTIEEYKRILPHLLPRSDITKDYLVTTMKEKGILVDKILDADGISNSSFKPGASPKRLQKTPLKIKLSPCPAPVMTFDKPSLAELMPGLYDLVEP